MTARSTLVWTLAKLSEDDLFSAAVAALEARDCVAIFDRERYLVQTRELRDDILKRAQAASAPAND